MNQAQVTLQGYAGTDPLIRTVGDVQVASFRFAVTPSRFDRASQRWIDSETQWYSINCWRNLARNVAGCVRKGDPLVVTGRLTQSSYVNKEGVLSTVTEVDAMYVGHDLVRTMTKVYRPRDIEQTATPEQSVAEDLDAVIEAVTEADHAASVETDRETDREVALAEVSSDAAISQGDLVQV